MNLDRKDLLQRLIAVSPGLAKTDRFLQGKCVVLRKGRFYTLSQELACSVASGLPPDFAEVAVRADKLLKMLKELPDDAVDVTLTRTLNIAGKRDTCRLAVESEVKLDVGGVELPREWLPLDEDFADAVAVVAGCTVNAGAFQHTCVHVNPEFIEASDNVKMARFTIALGVAAPFLVRGRGFKEVAALGMTKVAETANWLHFKNPLGLRASVAKIDVEKYPNLESFLALRGRKVRFPKLLANVARRAAVVADEDTGIKVEVSPEGELTVEGRGVHGRYAGKRTLLNYRGKGVSFLVPPKMMIELVQKHNRVEVTDVSLRVNGGRYVFATSLNAPKEDGRA